MLALLALGCGADDDPAGPADAAPVDAALVADTTRPDANEPDTSEPDAGVPCLHVTPEEGLIFGGVQVDGRLQKPIMLESCGSAPVTIRAVSMAAGSDDALELVRDSLPSFPAHLPPMAPGEPMPSRPVKIECRPTDNAAYGGTVIVESDDPERPEVHLPVTCLGVRNECPVPAVVERELRVAPFDVVLLDGTPSTDLDGPGGKPVGYRWEVIEAPAGSFSVPVERLGLDPQAPLDGATPDAYETPTARFLVDVVGTYTMALYVEDNMDLEAPSRECPEPQATVTIVATAEDVMHIEMWWHTPGDPNETDFTGTDMDLHLLGPTGETWGEMPGDCYFANPSPDWGVPGDATDDPNLELNDRDGAGPETIRLEAIHHVSSLGRYRVGVEYFREESTTSLVGFGPSYVSVRLYLDGLLAYANDQPKELRRTGQIWEPVNIDWSLAGRRVDVIDEVTWPQ